MNIIKIDLGKDFALRGFQIGNQIQSSIFDEGYAIENTFGYWTKEQAIIWLKLEDIYNY